MSLAARQSGAIVASPTREAALERAAEGVRVVPVHTVEGGRCSCGRPDCDSPGKHPRFLRGVLEHGADDATTDPDLIRELWRRWPDANLGLRTGQVSGIVVLDLDSLEAIERAERLGWPRRTA